MSISGPRAFSARRRPLYRAPLTQTSSITLTQSQATTCHKVSDFSLSLSLSLFSFNQVYSHCLVNQSFLKSCFFFMYQAQRISLLLFYLKASQFCFLSEQNNNNKKKQKLQGKGMRSVLAHILFQFFHSLALKELYKGIKKRSEFK